MPGALATTADVLPTNDEATAPARCRSVWLSSRRRRRRSLVEGSALLLTEPGHREGRALHTHRASPAPAPTPTWRNFSIRENATCPSVTMVPGERRLFGNHGRYGR